MRELSDLLQKAEEILRSDPDSPELVGLVESYTEHFERWQSLVGETLANVLSSPQGEELVRVHAAVLARAQSAQGDVAQALKGLRKRGKGILAYTDTFPKRIATIRPRKG
jgi:hypothetical protein